MYQLIAPLGRWGRRLKRPEHRDGKHGRHGHGEGDVEIFAHSPAFICAARMAQAYALKLDIAGKLQTFERTGTWGFRYAVVIQCFNTAVLNWMANIF